MTKANQVINTKQDLMNLVDSNPQEALKQIEYLRGSTVKTVDVQVYPEDPNEPKPEPIFEQQEDLSTLNSFGLTIEDLDDLEELCQE